MAWLLLKGSNVGFKYRRYTLFDIKYDDIFLGDGEYIVLNEELNDAYRRTVLDSSLNVVFTEDYDNKYMPLCFGSGFYNGVVELSGFQNLLHLYMYLQK